MRLHWILFACLVVLCTAAQAVEVTLEWDPPNDGQPPTGYGVERSYDGVNFTSIGVVDAPQATIVDTAPRAPQTCWRAYAYAIVNFEWRFSAYSKTLCLDFAPPAPPTETWLTLQGEDSEKTITLGWAPPALAESFATYRKLGDNSPYELYNEDKTLRSLDTQMPDMFVCRYVITRNTLGESAPGPTICVTSSRAPANVTVTATGADQVLYLMIQPRPQP